MRGDPGAGGQGAGAGRGLAVICPDRAAQTVSASLPGIASSVLASYCKSAGRGWKGMGSHFWSGTQGKGLGCLAPHPRRQRQRLGCWVERCPRCRVALGLRWQGQQCWHLGSSGAPGNRTGKTA